MRDVRLKLMPNGDIRAFRANTADKAGASEWMITSTENLSATITVAHAPKIIEYEE